MKLLSLLIATAMLVAVAGMSTTVSARTTGNCPSGNGDSPYCAKNPPGQYCKAVPKTKLAGQKKTQFAQCVTAMAKIKKNQDLAPSQVCAGLKKAKGAKAKAKGKKAYAKCVRAGKNLKLDLANS